MAVMAATDDGAAAFGDADAEADPEAVWGALWQAGARVLSTGRADAFLRWRARRVAA
ncbi:DUF4996 domain-containing protein [Mangrovicoccus ximenensis]|uniref:DUF4996 domain-containing protein n=1 Tax=Mangrovicoccus ximenensis TaxID=1911570 RepID=UPI001F345D69|nr:DUF4996 domain-containing protein [Mangrovicoccus ximenensis]